MTLSRLRNQDVGGRQGPQSSQGEKIGGRLRGNGEQPAGRPGRGRQGVFEQRLNLVIRPTLQDSSGDGPFQKGREDDPPLAGVGPTATQVCLPGVEKAGQPPDPLRNPGLQLRPEPGGHQRRSAPRPKSRHKGAAVNERGDGEIAEGGAIHHIHRNARLSRRFRGAGGEGLIRMDDEAKDKAGPAPGRYGFLRGKPDQLRRASGEKSKARLQSFAVSSQTNPASGERKEGGKNVQVGPFDAYLRVLRWAIRAARSLGDATAVIILPPGANRVGAAR